MSEPHTTPTSFWRNPALVGFLAGGWAATLLMILLPHLGVRTALAEDPPTPNVPGPTSGPQSGQNPGIGPTVNPLGGSFTPRGGQPVPGLGTSDSNNHAIALAASIGGGESAVYYFDTKSQRLLVYQYKGIIQGSKPLDGRDRGGLRLLAARHMDYDLRLEGYRDLSQRTRAQLKSAYDASFSGGKVKGSNPFPVKKVSESK
ncbi:MAG: hypothetical protein P1V36_01040 [Planctomycetota bacterium]|nr:hypothetical protein [Planctomycetota bacterium]